MDQLSTGVKLKGSINCHLPHQRESTVTNAVNHCDPRRVYTTRRELIEIMEDICVKEKERTSNTAILKTVEKTQCIKCLCRSTVTE